MIHARGFLHFGREREGARPDCSDSRLGGRYEDRAVWLRSSRRGEQSAIRGLSTSIDSADRSQASSSANRTTIRGTEFEGALHARANAWGVSRHELTQDA